jgi:hypothetical protein
MGRVASFWNACFTNWCARRNVEFWRDISCSIMFTCALRFHPNIEPVGEITGKIAETLS